MSDDGLVAKAVRIIGCATRDNVDLGVRSFEIWKESCGLDPTQCVEVAAKELYENDRRDDYSSQ